MDVPFRLDKNTRAGPVSDSSHLQGHPLNRQTKLHKKTSTFPVPKGLRDPHSYLSLEHRTKLPLSDCVTRRSRDLGSTAPYSQSPVPLAQGGAEGRAPLSTPAGAGSRALILEEGG